MTPQLMVTQDHGLGHYVAIFPRFLDPGRPHSEPFAGAPDGKLTGPVSWPEDFTCAFP